MRFRRLQNNPGIRLRGLFENRMTEGLGQVAFFHTWEGPVYVQAVVTPGCISFRHGWQVDNRKNLDITGEFEVLFPTFCNVI